LAISALNSAIGVVPESLRATLIAALSKFLLFLFGTASMRALSDVGGMAFVGAAVLSVLAFSAAATSGPIGALAALPGMIAAAYLIHEFLAMIDGLHRGSEEVADSRPSALARRLGPLLSRLDVLRPGQSRGAALAFVALPTVAIVAVIGVAVVSGTGDPGRFAYWISWSGQRAGILWSVWAFAVTPRSVRIPLWSGAAWSGLILAVVFFNPVSAVFGLAMTAILFINVMIVVMRWSGAWRRPMAPPA